MRFGRQKDGRGTYSPVEKQTVRFGLEKDGRGTYSGAEHIIRMTANKGGYMRIIRAKEGESIYTVAAECGIAPQLLKEISGIEGRMLNEGREIGAYTPSRSYVVRTGDSLRSICERFGVKEQDVIRLNPELADGRLYRGQYLALGLCEGKVGALAVNGNLYRGCPAARLRAVLPYLNTLTVAAARAAGRDIRLDGGMLEAARLARSRGVSP